MTTITEILASIERATQRVWVFGMSLRDPNFQSILGHLPGHSRFLDLRILLPYVQSSTEITGTESRHTELLINSIRNHPGQVKIVRVNCSPFTMLAVDDLIYFQEHGSAVLPTPGSSLARFEGSYAAPFRYLFEHLWCEGSYEFHAPPEVVERHETFTIHTTPERMRVSDLSLIMDSLQVLVTGSIATALFEEAPTLEQPTSTREKPFLKLRELVIGDPELLDAMKRFAGPPEQEIRHPAGPSERSAGQESELSRKFVRSIYDRAPSLYRDVFSFARVDRVEYTSPMIIDVVVSGMSAAAVVLIGLLSSASRLRRLSAEAVIREKEALIKEQELRQLEIKTDVMDLVRREIQVRVRDRQLQIPENAIVSLSTVTSAAITDLGTTPLIGDITIGSPTRRN